MTKTVAFKMPKPASAEQWVAQGGKPLDRETAAAGPPMKRFTVDVSAELHSRIKGRCGLRGLKIADVIRDLLEREFPAD